MIILALTLILFGPERLLQMSRAVGRGTRELRRAMADVREEIEEATRVDPPRDDG